MPSKFLCPEWSTRALPQEWPSLITELQHTALKMFVPASYPWWATLWGVPSIVPMVGDPVGCTQHCTRGGRPCGVYPTLYPWWGTLWGVPIPKQPNRRADCRSARVKSLGFLCAAGESAQHVPGVNHDFNQLKGLFNKRHSFAARSNHKPSQASQ